MGGWNTLRAEFIIGADDLLGISVYGYKDLESKARVSSNGRISFPLIGELNVAGLSTFKVEKLIAASLTEGKFIQDAPVTVTVLENNSQRVSILGQVNKPGRYALGSVTTLVDVVAMAGGIKESGDETVILTHFINGKAHKKVINLYAMLKSTDQKNLIRIMSRDRIFVPKAPLFYIYGEVQQPGGYKIVNNMTIVKALSIGGGLTKTASQSGIIIKRKDSKGVLQEVDAELTDQVLKDDVVFVKERWF
jgi:polysaccharide export outer membrane protein